MSDPHRAALDRLRAGDRAAALALLHAALAAEPLNADIHNSLGVVLGAAGDAEGAIVCFGQATRLAPEDARYFANLGLALHRQDRAEAAIAAFSRAEQLDPDSFETRLQLGLLLRAQGSVAGALLRLTHAVALRPEHPGAHMALATALHAGGRLAEAVAEYDRVLALRSDLAEAHAARALALQEMDRLHDAIAGHRTALALRPELLETRCNLSECLRATGDVPAALREAAIAAAAHPQSALARRVEGMALLASGDPDRGEAALRWASTLEPLTAEQAFATALVQLLLGDWGRGWVGYDGRVHAAPRRVRMRAPEWEGGALAGRRLALFCEQGLGDTLQFLRYLPLVAGRAGPGEILLQVPPAIAPLLAGWPGLAAGMSVLCCDDAALPGFDVQISLLSLPRLFATRPESVPPVVPFASRARAPRGGRLQVGLAWSGRAAHRNDRNRSLRLAALAPVLGAGNCDFHVLQPELRPGDVLADWPMLVDHHDALPDFAATAALLAGMDLVITVDTALAHLAGSMGLPVWLLLPAVPDWRWLLRRSDTPWYPGMTLYRQERAGAWGPVLSVVASALARAAQS